MRIQRLYRCTGCGHKYRRVFTVSDRAEIVDPPCPHCTYQAPPVPERVAAPMIGGTKSRAVDEAWRIAQEDFGLTNMRDNAHEGETAFIAPPTEAPDPRTITRPQMIWGGASPSSSPLQMPGQAALVAAAKGSAAIANAEDRNPMRMLHRQRPKLHAIPLNKS